METPVVVTESCKAKEKKEFWYKIIRNDAVAKLFKKWMA